MHKRDIHPGRAYGDGKKGKRLVLRVTEDTVCYRLITATRPRDMARLGDEFDVQRSNFATWAVELVHDADGYLHDEDVQRSLDEEARHQARRKKPWPPLPCAHVCAPCEEAQWEESYQRAQAEMQSEKRPPQRTRYANVGRSRSDAKVAASRENGRRGGRPKKWTATVRTIAAKLLRGATDSVLDKELQEEMGRLARALEDGSYR